MGEAGTAPSFASSQLGGDCGRRRRVRDGAAAGAAVCGLSNGTPPPEGMRMVTFRADPQR